MKKNLYEYCLESNLMYPLDEWDAEKNEGLTFKNISYSSKKEVWWKCERGHQWHASVYIRTNGKARCPYCTGRMQTHDSPAVVSDFPMLVKEWHPIKNQNLTPSDVSIGSHRKIWWICEKKHEWEARVQSRTSGTGCPICTNRKVLAGENDLATTHPQIASQWHPTKNGKLTPQAVVPGNPMKAWWVCPHGHEYKAAINLRTVYGTGCSVCSGKQVLAGCNDLASAYPEIAAQRHTTLNGELPPQMVTRFSNRKVWWLCENGHAFEAFIKHRTQSLSGCPYCTGHKVLAGFNDLATLDPALAKQWHPTLNGSLTPEMVTCGSQRKVWWQCSQGHVWKAIIYSRAKGRKHGCPVCAGTVNDKRSEKYGKLIEKMGHNE